MQFLFGTVTIVNGNCLKTEHHPIVSNSGKNVGCSTMYNVFDPDISSITAVDFWFSNYDIGDMLEITTLSMVFRRWI